MLIDEMEITQHRKGGKTIFRLGFSIEMRQPLDDTIVENADFDMEDAIKRRMRHRVKEKLFKLFLENVTAELFDRHMYVVDSRYGAAMFEHPLVEIGRPITLIHPVDFAELLQKHLILGDFFEWKKGEFTK